MIDENLPVYIRINYILWWRLKRLLKINAKKYNESGAFLLGTSKGNETTVKKIVSYEKLDPRVYRAGTIEFRGLGKSKLWKLCREKNLNVVADCHTHPSNNTNQSYIDMHHPMIPVKGHISLIFPNYADKFYLSRKLIGVHLYLGKNEWKRIDKTQKENPIIILCLPKLR